MSEVFPGTDLKCEEITMAVHRMQNLQLLSNTGQKCCKYKAESIWTHTHHFLPRRPGGRSLPVNPWGFVASYLDLLSPPLCSIGLISFRKTLNDGKVLYVFNRDPLYTHACCSLSGWDAFLWFMRSGLSHGMLQPAAFKNAKRWGVYTVWLLRLPPGCHFKALFSTDGRTGLSLSRQWGSNGLLGALHAYQMISASPGRFAISGLQYWPYS